MSPTRRGTHPWHQIGAALYCGISLSARESTCSTINTRRFSIESPEIRPRHWYIWCHGCAVRLIRAWVKVALHG